MANCGLLFAIFAALVCVVHGEPKSPCSRGSSYWCENYRQAKECGALVPCTEYVWKPRVGPDPYAVCRASVKAMSDYVKTGVTREQFRKGFQGMCRHLHCKKDECVRFVGDNDEFLFQQFKKLLSDSKPWCEGLLLREANEQTTRVQGSKVLSEFIRDAMQHFSKVQVEFACIQCQLIVTQLANFLRNRVTEQEIARNILENACGYIEPLRQQCKALADVYAQILLVSAINYLTPVEKTCRRLKICEKTKPVKQRVVTYLEQSSISGNPFVEDGKITNDPNPMFGDVCMMTVEYWENIVPLDLTLDALRIRLTRMCDVMPMVYESQCRKMSAQHGNQIINLLHRYHDPRAVCMLLFLSSHQQFMMGNRGSKNTFCENCKQMTTFVTEQFQFNKTKKAMEENMKLVCEMMPNGLKCKSIVTLYGNLVIDYIKAFDDPDTICKFLYICPMSNTQMTDTRQTYKNSATYLENKIRANHFKDLPLSRPLRQSPPPLSTVCALCQKIVTIFLRFIRLNETELAIKKVIAGVCILLPIEKEETCLRVIHHYGDQIIQKLAIYHSPAFICKAILLCRPGVSTILKSKKRISCEGCSPLEQSIAEFLPTHHSKIFVQQAARRVCNDLIAVRRIQPRTLCSTSRLSTLHQENTACATCKQVVAYLEGVFRVNQTLEMLKIAVTGVCVILPVEREEICKGIIGFYANKFTAMVQLQISPHLICKRLLLCPPSRPFSLQNGEDQSPCDNCQEIMAYLGGVFEMNQTIAVLRQNVVGACGILPAESKEECQKFVSDNAGRIIAMIHLRFKPITVCKMVLQCPVSKPTFSLQMIEKQRICDMCLQFVAVLEGTFRLNQTLAAMKIAAVYACSIFPAEREQLCIGVVAKQADTIITMINLRLKPITVCSTLFVCRPSQGMSLSTSLEQSPVCDTCKQVVAFMLGAFRVNRTMEAMKYATAFACSILPVQLEIKCKENVIQKANIIIGLITLRTNPNAVCKIIFQCPVSKPTFSLQRPEGHPICETCLGFVAFLEGTFKMNQTLAAMRIAVVEACRIFPSETEAKCRKNVATQADGIIMMIKLNLKPFVICRTLFLCHPTQGTSLSTSLKQVPLCDMCKQVVAFMLGAFRVNQTMEAMKQATAFACSMFPVQLEIKCKDNVINNANIIIGLIKFGANPNAVCKTLLLCSRSSRSLSLKTPTRDQIVCGSCQQVVAFLEGAFKVNQTLQAMKFVVLQSCNIVPDKYKEECQKKVLQYANNIIKMIEIRTNPAAICTILFLCPAGRVCDTCKQVVSFVEGSFQINQTIAAMKMSVIYMCNILPPERIKQCEDVLRQRADNIIALIQMRIKPCAICKMTFLCAAHQMQRLSQYNSGPVCDLCRAAVSRVHKIYRIERSEKALKNAMVTTCHAFPWEYTQRCNNMVNDYGRNIMDKLRRSQNPAAVCQIMEGKLDRKLTKPETKFAQLAMTLDLCVKDVQWMRNGCHSGQEYWCASLGNAVKCKALQYCNPIHA